eukprot:XP_001710007.1 Hypothetical protein GL50803_32143 [Giardia lamblia ATCC 50803]
MLCRPSYGEGCTAAWEEGICRCSFHPLFIVYEHLHRLYFTSSRGLHKGCLTSSSLHLCLALNELADDLRIALLCSEHQCCVSFTAGIAFRPDFIGVTVGRPHSSLERYKGLHCFDVSRLHSLHESGDTLFAGGLNNLNDISKSCLSSNDECSVSVGIFSTLDPEVLLDGGYVALCSCTHKESPLKNILFVFDKTLDD